MVAQRLRGTDNRVIVNLSRTDRAHLESFLKPVELKVRTRLESANSKVNAIYFLERGLASVVGTGGERRQAEVAIIGREGMTGASFLLGVDRSPHETFMQLEGEGLYITADHLRLLMTESDTLTSSLLRYVHLFLVQVAHTAVANAKGNIEERLARWLLMVHDRVEGDDVKLTHDFLAQMLGVRRAGVTTAMNKLEALGLMENTRGCITILDRGGLEKVAGGLYGAPEAEYLRLFG